ncbi:MAG: hypothetical protein Q8P07_00700 [bacterium]|nr:hypothetical protein [bacterium]
MNKMLTKEEVDEIYATLTPEYIEELIELISFSHSKWNIKHRKPSKREIVDWHRMKQRALVDTGNSMT